MHFGHSLIKTIPQKAVHYADTLYAGKWSWLFPVTSKALETIDFNYENDRNQGKKYLVGGYYDTFMESQLWFS